jgi:hypothetical protein
MLKQQAYEELLMTIFAYWTNANYRDNHKRNNYDKDCKYKTQAIKFKFTTTSILEKATNWLTSYTLKHIVISNPT